MIEFDCPECGEVMEISSRMAGQQVRCLECNEMVEVPERTTKRRASRKAGAKNDYLTGTEYALYALLFLVVPCANVIISSILYYVWRRDLPTKAGQINVLGFAIFGLQIVLRHRVGRTDSLRERHLLSPESPLFQYHEDDNKVAKSS